MTAVTLSQQVERRRRERQARVAGLDPFAQKFYRLPGIDLDDAERASRAVHAALTELMANYRRVASPSGVPLKAWNRAEALPEGVLYRDTFDATLHAHLSLAFNGASPVRCWVNPNEPMIDGCAPLVCDLA